MQTQRCDELQRGVIRISADARALPAPPLWLYPLVAAIPVAYAATFAVYFRGVVAGFGWTQPWTETVRHGFWLLTFATLPPLLLLLACEPIAWLSRRRTRRLAQRLEREAAAINDSNCAQVSDAVQAVQAMVTRERLRRSAHRMRDQGIDVEKLRALSTRSGQPVTMIAMGGARSRPSLALEPTEVIDLGAGRRRGAQERRGSRWLRRISASVAALATLWVLTSGLPAWIAGVVWAGSAPPALLSLWPLIVRRGWRPIDLSATLAAPARVEIIRLGRSKLFTTADSILILEPMRQPLEAVTWAVGRAVRGALDHLPWIRGTMRSLVIRYVRLGWLSRWRHLERRIGLGRYRKPVTATLVRNDGAMARLRFFSGRYDPALADLVVRWTALTT